jgi:hypothetical protein
MQIMAQIVVVVCRKRWKGKKPKRLEGWLDLTRSSLIVDIATGQVEDKRDSPPSEKAEKDPAAVSLGRRGGLKGGKARAASLTAKQRREIARKAATARWQK